MTPPRTHVTMRRPALLVLAAVVLVLVGGAIDSATLFALAVADVALVVGAVLWTTLALRRLDVRRTIVAGEVVEGEPLRVAFAVRGLPRLPVRVEALGPDGRWVALGSGGGTIELRVGRRGPHVIGPSPLRVSDDLGIVRRLIHVGREHPLLVLPAVLPAPPGLPGGAARAGDPEPDGLRAYRPGTPMSRIHWASLARGGELQERVMTAAPSGLPLVVVDTAAAPDAAAVDWAARAAAGAVRELADSGGCRVLLPGAPGVLCVTDPSGWPAVHRALAHLGVGAAGADPNAFGDVVRIDAAAAPAAGARPPLPVGVAPLP
jgi:uncharacterized protein (DUF58 family)